MIESCVPITIPLFFRRMMIMPRIQTRVNDDETKKNTKTTMSIGVGRLKLFNTSNSLYASECGRNRQTFTHIKQKKRLLSFHSPLRYRHWRPPTTFPSFSPFLFFWEMISRRKRKEKKARGTFRGPSSSSSSDSDPVGKSTSRGCPFSLAPLRSSGPAGLFLFLFVFVPIFFFTCRLHVDCLRPKN